MPVVHAVVVAYNRVDLLVRGLAALAAQTRRPDVIHVVDNASTDDTALRVRQEFPDVQLHRLSVNTGGAGGFAYGIRSALDSAADLVWLMDDDTIPTPTALDALLTARDGCPSPPPALVASRVVWTDGRDHPMNTPRIRPGVGRDERSAAAAVGCVPIRSASFVSALVDAQVVREIGLPRADYFLWNDDFEFSTRLLRKHRGLYCPASVVEHHTRTFGDTDTDPGDRFYFEVRNKLWIFTRSDGLTLTEKALYGGSTGRRWLRTFAASSDRARLWRGLRRGVVDGTRRGPRPTEQILDELKVDDS